MFQSIMGFEKNQKNDWFDVFFNIKEVKYLFPLEELDDVITTAWEPLKPLGSKQGGIVIVRFSTFLPPRLSSSNFLWTTNKAGASLKMMHASCTIEHAENSSSKTYYTM